SFYKGSGETRGFLEESSQEYGELVGIIGISKSYGMAYDFSFTHSLVK
ncbi:tripartite tricarboxylate transporter substrate binding protein, partial [Bacillus cereus]|nr:tripartite tricarboxylate transporter substrate binding protein [Bacillus cereus]